MDPRSSDEIDIAERPVGKPRRVNKTIVFEGFVVDGKEPDWCFDYDIYDRNETEEINKIGRDSGYMHAFRYVKSKALWEWIATRKDELRRLLTDIVVPEACKDTNEKWWHHEIVFEVEMEVMGGGLNHKDLESTVYFYYTPKQIKSATLGICRCVSDGRDSNGRYRCDKYIPLEL